MVRAEDPGHAQDLLGGSSTLSPPVNICIVDDRVSLFPGRPRPTWTQRTPGSSWGAWEAGQWRDSWEGPVALGLGPLSALQSVSLFCLVVPLASSCPQQDTVPRANSGSGTGAQGPRVPPPGPTLRDPALPGGGGEQEAGMGPGSPVGACGKEEPSSDLQGNRGAGQCCLMVRDGCSWSLR